MTGLCKNPAKGRLIYNGARFLWEKCHGLGLLGLVLVVIFGGIVGGLIMERFD